MTSGAFINHSIFTPQRFSLLAPYMQTEALLLAVEFGNAPGVIAASIDLPVARVSAIMRERHCHGGAMQVDQTEDGEEARAPVGLMALRTKVLRQIRRMMDADGVSRASTTDMAEALGARNASVARSVRELIAKRFVVCVLPGRSIRAAQYRITPAGHDRLAEIDR